MLVDDTKKTEMSRVQYASAVSSLMYVMVCTRPDIAYALRMVVEKKAVKIAKVITKDNPSDMITKVVPSNGDLLVMVCKFCRPGLEAVNSESKYQKLSVDPKSPVQKVL
uniref:Uncharacterized protein n=1 Tax=Cannabis sativa TaxID=3483 RepID=A0A803QEG1_CANSA